MEIFINFEVGILRGSIRRSVLRRRFGGERRQLQNYLKDIKKVKPLQEGNIQELEKFADFLVTIVVTLREHNRVSDLEPGSLLFSLVVEKLPKTMLSRYFSWASKNHRWCHCRRFEIGLSRNQSTKLRPWKASEGSVLKGSTRRMTVDRIVPLLL